MEKDDKLEEIEYLRKKVKLLEQYNDEIKAAGIEALRLIGELKTERKALIDGGNRLLEQRNEAIRIADSILHEHEARDQQSADTILDSYEFSISRDWYPFLDKIKWEE